MLSEGRLLGHYRLVRRIGGGGMGEVYLAEDTRINRQVAIKVVRTETEPYPDPVATQDAARLFQREMRAITMLDHPHILPLYDFGEEKDVNMNLTYMIMPYRQDGSLTDWLQKRGKSERLTPNEVSHFVMQAADALQHAHDHGLVHQDVKPSNFLVRPRSGHVLPDLLLMDFGIAKITTATTTASQSIRGTPAYMAPEQWRGQPQSATDQYALAVMAYLLLTGRTPFSGRMEQVMSQHFMDQPQPPGSLNPTLPPALDAVILRALEKEPGKRFPSIHEFAQAFQQALQSAGNQDATVIAPRNLQLASAPFENPASAASASTPNLSMPPPLVNSYNISNPNRGTPIPSRPIVSQSGSRKKKYNLKLLIVIVVLVGVVIISSLIGVNIYQSQLNANNPYPSYLSGNGTLAFVDSLSQEFGSKWGSFSTNSTGGSCQFTGGAYHVIQQSSATFAPCQPDGTFSNFAFEVHLTIIQGACGGIVFRDDGNGHFYKFEICQDGTYRIVKYAGDGSSYITALQPDSLAITTGLGKQNKIAVVASGSVMTFYVNEQQVDQAQDSSYTSGSIGLIAVSGISTTDVAYTNARLWTL